MYNTCVPIINTNIQIGSGTAAGNSIFPAYGLYNYSHEMFIYTAAQIGGEKQITGIQLNMASYTRGYTFINQKIKLAYTTDIEFGTSVQILNTNGDITGVAGVTNITTVKNTFTFTITASGWININFDTPFCYNGIDNLLLIWENRDGSWTTGYGNTRVSTPVGFQSWYKYQDSSYPTGYGTRDSTGKPNIKLNY
jgi:hypothetical protein